MTARPDIFPDRPSHATAFIVFGATGDLAGRKLYPALYELARRGLLPRTFIIYGMARRPLNDRQFGTKVRDAVRAVARGPIDRKALSALVRCARYFPGDLNDPATFTRLEEEIKKEERRLGHGILRTFYLALPPSLFDIVVSNVDACRLGKDMCTKEGVRSRVIIEKPFGSDLASAMDLERRIARTFDERQVYRIDHYLGKESLQNISTFRFANRFFEEQWNARNIAEIQISAFETVGLEGRTAYYDHAGALRDMVQSHLLQFLAHLTYDEPSSLTAEHIHAAKERLLSRVRVAGGLAIIRGRYRGYLEEPGIPSRSRTETYVAVKLGIDSARWRGVPIYIRTGKRMARKETSAVVSFRRRTPPQFAGLHEGAAPNRLSLQIAPSPSITLQMNVDRPGFDTGTEVATMQYCRDERFDVPPVGDYEYLLVDVMQGDRTLFTSAKEVVESWKVVEPLLSRAGNDRLYAYDPGSDGPSRARALFPKGSDGWTEAANGCTIGPGRAGR